MTARDVDRSIDHLERLLKCLPATGLRGEIRVRADLWPCLHVVNPAVPALNEDVTAANSPSGTWYFWFSWREPIADVAAPDQAAARLAQVLS